ncbi:MAG: PKD domain-containing protein, partial [Candidatus Thermoplasmatota archaeon]|nr:PKD domain-containing protein [Candidatus Thermoplasmatota archaeon]
ISSMDFDENEVATFDGSRCTDNVGIVNWTWTFDDGGRSMTLFGENASCIFSKQGKYTIDLTVRDEAGNSATDTMIVNIHEADGLGQFLRDHWWIVPILLVVLILILAFFLFKRGKITGSSEPIPPETTNASPPISTDERSA